MNFSLFIANRLFKVRGDSRKVSPPVIKIAMAGVALGLAVMIVSLSVVLGFKQEVRNKIIGFGSHIQIFNYQTLSTGVLHPIAFSDTMLAEVRNTPGVSHIQKYCDKTGVFKTDTDFKGVQLRGIDNDYDTTFLNRHIIAGQMPSFSDTISSSSIVVSKRISDQLGLKVGDKIYAYFFENSIRARRFTVSAIYETNLTEFDDILVFTDIYTTRRLNQINDDQCTGMEITVDDFAAVDGIASSLIKKNIHESDSYGQSYTTRTVKELYPQIFSWLDLLDLNVWVILALMLGVAGFTMISGLLIIILERTNFIGLMKAMGADNSCIRRIFINFAIFIIGRGMLYGNIFALSLILVQKYFGVVKLDPATYYVDSVPVSITLSNILLVNVCTFLVSVMVLIFPSFLVSNIHPAKSIRYE